MNRITFAFLSLSAGLFVTNVEQLPATAQAACGCERKISRGSDPDPRTGRPGVYFDCVRRSGQQFTEWDNIWYHSNGSVGGYKGNMPKGCVPKDMMNQSTSEMVDTLTSRISALRGILGYGNNPAKSALEVSTLSNDQSVFSGYTINKFESEKQIKEILNFSGELLSESEAAQISESVLSWTPSTSDLKVSPYLISIQTPSGSVFTAVGACASKNTSNKSGYSDGPVILKIKTKGNNYKMELDIAQSYYYYLLTSSKNPPCPFKWNDDAVKKFERKISAETYGLN